MLKQFLGTHDAGGTARFWDANWQSEETASTADVARWDPLARFFLEHTPRGARVLEGGCGLAPYLFLLEESDRRAVGLDFALNTLARVRSVRPGTPLLGGDVAALPFRDGAFDVYISQGVVEHFEAGPEAALAEAFRVLTPGGLLLISVPDYNWLRRVLMLGRQRRPGSAPAGGDWVRVEGHAVTVAPEGSSFFQYVYPRKRFASLLVAHGFTVDWDCGYSVLWGLQDLPPFRTLMGLVERRYRRGATASRVAVDHPASGRPGPAPVTPRFSGRLRALVLREHGAGPLSRFLVRCFTETCANMRLYAARKPLRG